MENKQHDCDDVGCVACILEKHLMGLWERATDPAFLTFEVTAADIQMLLTSIETGQLPNQISALIDIDDAGVIPAEKPLAMAASVWDVVKSGDDTSMPHVFRMSRISYIACLLSIDEALHRLSIGDISNAVLVYGHANMLFGETIGRGCSAYAKGSLHDTASAGARVRHRENHAMKQDVFNWLDANPPKARGMDAAATAIFESKLVPIKSWRTARDWVGEWKKLRSAGTA